MPFTKVTYLSEFPDNNNSPAMVNRKSGELYINLDRWKDIAFVHRVFIILHELAHVKLDSSDELAVDALAHKWYVDMGYSLTESVHALTKVLHADSKVNYERSLAQYQRAKEIEDRNNVLSGYEGFDEIKNNPNCYITEIQDAFDGESIIVHFDEFDVNAEVDGVKGLSRKAARKKKRAVKLYKKIGKGKKKNAIANDIQAGADTRQTYADQGILVETRAQSVSKGVGGAIQSITSALGGGFGTGISSLMPEAEMPEEAPGTSFAASARKMQPATVAAGGETSRATPSAPSNNTMKYALIGGGALALVGTIILIAKK